MTFQFCTPSFYCSSDFAIVKFIALNLFASFIVITLTEREKAKSSTILIVGKEITIEKDKRKEAKN